MDLLERVLQKILGSNPTLSQGVQDAKIMETWPLAVGDALAKHARAVQVKGRTLLVEVDHSIWKQELHSNKALALKKLNEKLSEVFGESKLYVDDLFLLSKSPSKTKPEPR
jgi:predicted nucleic acid-binding Zn ribbon protein